MIDTKELRKLVQAATPGPWINYGRQPNAPGAPHSAVAAKTLLARVYSEAYGDVAQETANAAFIAAANPAAISELLDRLEAAELAWKEADKSCHDLTEKVIPNIRTELLDRLEAAESEALEQARLNGMGSEREAALMAKLEAAERERDECNARRLEAADNFSAQVREISSALEETRRERDVEEQRACDLHVECCNLITEIDALRAKVAEMERQEPVAWYSKQYGFVYMSRHHSQFEHGSILYLRNGTPAWRIEGSAKVALLDIASLPHGTVFYAAPGAKGE